jgi:hypothetical protein
MRAPARSACGVGVRGRHDGWLLPYSDGDLQQSDIRRMQLVNGSRRIAQHSRGVWYCPGIGCRLVDSCSTISALDCYPAAAANWRRRLGGESDLGRSRAVAAEVQRAAVLGPTSSHPLCCCGNIAATSASTSHSAELRSTHPCVNMEIE